MFGAYRVHVFDVLEGDEERYRHHHVHRQEVAWEMRDKQHRITAPMTRTVIVSAFYNRRPFRWVPCSLPASGIALLARLCKYM